MEKKNYDGPYDILCMFFGFLAVINPLLWFSFPYIISFYREIGWVVYGDTGYIVHMPSFITGIFMEVFLVACTIYYGDKVK